MHLRLCHVLFVVSVEFAVCFKPASVLMHLNVSKSKVYREAAAVTGSELCTNVALEVLSEEGSAADAAIAALLCEGVANPQSMGIGGGFLLTIYDATNQKAEFLNARESAPTAACPDMFNNAVDITSGGLSIAVPGELMGYWELHKKYGRMAWYDLFRPAIDMARHGIPISSYTSKMIEKVKDDINASPTIKQLLTNPQTNLLYKKGETIRRPELADTLEDIARHGPGLLYRGNMTEGLVYDITENGGIITEDDMKNYKATWQPVTKKVIGDYKVYTASSPGCGSLLLMILEAMNRKPSSKMDMDFWHQLVELWKFAFGIRSHMSGPMLKEKVVPINVSPDVDKVLEKLKECGTYKSPEKYFGDHGNTEDHGTAHVSVLAPNGDAVSATSTINLSFGSLVVSESTGIILNNEMLDFSIPNQDAFKSFRTNQIAPNRQPLSTMLPTIVVDKHTHDVKLVIGASGGYKILSSLSSVILQTLYMNVPLEEAVEAKRLHHQLWPMVLEYEEGFNNEILQYLVEQGNELQRLEAQDKVNSSSSMSMYSCVNAISVVKDEIHAVADSRRNAYAGGY